MRTDKQIRESIDEKRQTYIDTAEFYLGTSGTYF